MYTLMIVEDEKMIRQGIKAIALRSGVALSQVIECRNGVEALAVLRNQPVDLMITDIRMPQMDGIELINAAKAEGILPLAIVISGYDDFSYAVELMRAGVRDYILKPVERAKLTDILQKMANELRQKNMQRMNARQLSLNQLKYLLLGSDSSLEEVDAAAQQFTAEYGDPPYTVIVSPSEPEFLPPVCIALSNVLYQTVIYCPESTSLEDFECPTGRSLPQTSVRDIAVAYHQALAARALAFACGLNGCVAYAPHEYTQSIPKDFPERQAQALSGDQFASIENEWRILFADMRAGHIDSQELGGCVNELFARIAAAYHGIVPLAEADIQLLRQPMAQARLNDYADLLIAWLCGYHGALSGQLSSYQNRQKIERARAYVEKNFYKELNMAIVSNEVSMNYSLFSTLFKLYVGEGFVAYIKRLRVNRAKELLRDTDLLVVEIGRKVGYENDKHFLKLFKLSCGVSPAEYRAYARMQPPGEDA